MPEERNPNQPQRRRKPRWRQNQLLPLIAILAAVLIVVSFTAVLMNVNGDPATQNTTPTSPTLAPTNPSNPTTPTDPTDPTDPTEPTDPEITVISTATIGATGDMLMHKRCITPGLQSDGSYNFDAYFAHFTSYVQAVDYAVANLETTLAGNSYPYQGNPNFNCPDGIATSLRSAGFDMMLTANNHSYDTGTTGFFRTQEVLSLNGLDYIGTKPDAESKSYLVKNINGIQVGMINYTYEDHYDPNVVALNWKNLKDNEKDLINAFYNSTEFATSLAKNVADMKADGAEAIVLYIHWGEEYETEYNNQQKIMAQTACDLGVDVIVGGHPHVIQPMELLTGTTDSTHKTVCLYSTGNALSNQRIDQMQDEKSGHTEDGIFFSFTFVKYSDGTVRVEAVEILPLWVNLYTSRTTGKLVYDILPLDKSVEDWKTAYTLSDATLTKAQASYDRTMAIVGAGLESINAYLAALPDLV